MDNNSPATPTEAEDLAKKAVSAYLDSCRLSDPAQISNYLMKLVSVAGVLMAHSEGSEAAVTRLVGTAQFIQKSMPKTASSIHTVQ
jgi:hypothetical protein